MTERERKQAEIDSKKAQIKKLNEEIDVLKLDCLLLSDDKQWYTETTEVQTSGRGKNVTTTEHLVGWVNWIEHFVDESTGKSVPIERRKAVKVDGEWI
jgi:hypothetical protein